MFENYQKMKEKNLVTISRTEKFGDDGELVVFVSQSQFDPYGEQKIVEQSFPFSQLEDTIKECQEVISKTQSQLDWLNELAKEIQSKEKIILRHQYLVNVTTDGESKKAVMHIFYKHEGTSIDINQERWDKVFDSEEEARDYMETIK